MSYMSRFKKKKRFIISHRTIQKILKIKLEHEAKTKILTEIINVLSGLIPSPNLETWKIYEKYFSNAENIIEEAGKLEFS